MVKGSDVEYSTDDLIHAKPIPIPHSTNILNTDVTVDDDEKLFKIPRKELMFHCNRRLGSVKF